MPCELPSDPSPAPSPTVLVLSIPSSPLPFPLSLLYHFSATTNDMREIFSLTCVGFAEHGLFRGGILNDEHTQPISYRH